MEISVGKITLSDKILRFPFDNSIDNRMISTSTDSKIPGWIDVSMIAGLTCTGSRMNFTS
jgi:hypothetical protein